MDKHSDFFFHLIMRCMSVKLNLMIVNLFGLLRLFTILRKLR